MEKKKKSRFAKITNIVIWIMLIATIGGVLLAAFASMITG
ncbi:DUF4044 domain-containing protein [Vagococcus entomophilus]|uniref:DUF4044 domain-containing protein n=1 Tax=Vagococcus entomophilus TaxID=1160095 RepID=A0A430AIB2_9ENTE|nr:DUF4044 domain-containing protein [Vagococcus entomophilus]RSU07821.1 DUF4044 domain-containing protein [Vagococcus entomophilus]